MTTALHYSSITPSNDPSQIYGLQVAIGNWLKAYFRYSQQEQFHILVGDKIAWNEIKIFAENANLDPRRLTILDQRFVRENMGHFDTLFRADPHPQKIFWQRQQLAPHSYNVCTLAHAVSGLEGGEILERYCLDPSQSTDAIVCPSHAVAKAIRSCWDLYSDYLKQRFGTSFRCPVQLPVIPLGIDIEHFEKITSIDERATQREKLGVGDKDIILLWVGRLSHAIKAHPLAMFQTAEQVATLTGAKIHLIMVGYFVPDDAQREFTQLAQDVLQKTHLHFIAHNDPRFPNGLWASGDIFLSLIDNMQESFGLTPIEAMAAGLPRVISDWDGYRDSVIHGDDGYLVRTLQPPPGEGRALSELLVNGRELYGGFLAKTAQCVAVDQKQAVEAIYCLIKDPLQRKQMAEKAHARVRATYDWRHIIPAYEALWSNLTKERKNAPCLHSTAWTSAHPQAPDPFTMFASYPSTSLQNTGVVRVVASWETIHQLWQHNINILALDILLPLETVTHIINQITEQKVITLDHLWSLLPNLDKSALWRTISWLIKLNILAYDPPLGR